jgi:hypothetical protein
MARRTTDEGQEHLAKIAFYKWEFLRRNVSYQRDYRCLMIRHGKALRRVGYPRFTQVQPLSNQLNRKLGTLHYKWGVGFMQNAKVRVIPSTMTRNPRSWSKNPFWGANSTSIIADSVAVSWDTAKFNSLAVDLRRRWEWLPLVVNLEARRKTIHLQLDAALDRFRTGRLDVESLPTRSRKRKSSDQTSWQSLARSAVVLPTHRTKPVRLEEATFDAYLKAWDMKQAGCSVADIVKGLGLTSDGEHPSQDNRQRAHRSILQAKRLIAGTYRNIS